MTMTKKWIGIAVGMLVATSLIAAPTEPPDHRGAREISEERGVTETVGIEDDSPTVVAKPGRLAPGARAGANLKAAPVIVLTPLDTELLMDEDRRDAQTATNKILRVGVLRNLEAAAIQGSWQELPGGDRLWATELISFGAVGIRVHFTRLELTEGMELTVLAPDDGTGAQAIEWVGEDSANREEWSPILPGEHVRIELLVPASSANRGDAELPFAMDSIQHLYRDPVVEPEDIDKAAGSCHNNVACYSSWVPTSLGVARVAFVSNSSSFVCSGQLLNNRAGDLTPYFLTANHCINTQTAANSAQFFWRYQTSTCGGTAPSLSTVPRSSRARLLRNGSASDYSLLMVEGALPSNLFWVGWTAATPSNGTSSASVHHPAGDYKRVSFGSKSSTTGCGGANHVRVNWSDGPTEPGSSGAGVFRSDTKQLYGQLHCGPSACGNETNDDFGAFSSTYPSISSFLAGGTDDGSEPNDSCSGARIVATGTYSSRVVKSRDSDWYAITVPAGRRLTVRLSFAHANGDIDTRLYAACGGSAVASGTGVTNAETISVTNTGSTSRTYRWQVYLYSDTRNTYNMTVTMN